MIRSMTAFAKREIKGTWNTATWELRSVNHRYLEIHIRLPEQFRSLELAIRERIRTHLTRGKIDCGLYCDVNSKAQNTMIFNKNLANQLIIAAQWIKMQSAEGIIDPLAILRWPGVMVSEVQDLDAISRELLTAFNATLNDFISAREIEGLALKTMIEQRLYGVNTEVSKIRQQIPRIIIWQRKRLMSKLKEAEVQLDTNRLEQEMVMLAQRLDVVEELDRLEFHIQETFKILNTKAAIGRRLDFMMQEFNRESNTLASKSINSSVTASAIELKVLIEQMREQIQNIE